MRAHAGSGMRTYARRKCKVKQIQRSTMCSKLEWTEIGLKSTKCINSPLLLLLLLLSEIGLGLRIGLELELLLSVTITVILFFPLYALIVFSLRFSILMKVK